MKQERSRRDVACYVLPAAPPWPAADTPPAKTLQATSLRQAVQSLSSNLELRLNIFGGLNISSAHSAYKLSLTESRISRCAFSEFCCQGDQNCMPQPTHTQTPTIQISVINESTVLADADVVPVRS